MNLPEYLIIFLKLIASQMERAIDKNDKDEVIRLAKLAKDTIDDILKANKS